MARCTYEIFDNKTILSNKLKQITKYQKYFTCASVRSDLQVHSWQGWTRGHCPEQSRWRLSWCDSGRWAESWCTHWHCHCNSQPLVLKQIRFITTENMFRSRTITCVDITIQKRLYSNAACMAIILLSKIGGNYEYRNAFYTRNPFTAILTILS